VDEDPLGASFGLRTCFDMRLLILDAMRPHLNPNPSIIRSVVAAFRRALRPDCVCTADQWNLERVAAAEEPDAVIAFSSRIWPRLLAHR
jgi:hypothetical protein